MSRELAILVPVLERPHRVAPLLDSIEASTPGAHVLFLADPGDAAERAAIVEGMRAQRSDLSIGALLDGGNYAEKINDGARRFLADFIFLAADDLEFQAGWFEAAKAAMTDGAEVVGVNDLLRRRAARRGHATHFLISRSYLDCGTIDEPEKLLHEGYDHSFVDDELIATAKKRGVYAYAAEARVRHLHWMGRSAPDDATYRKGRARFEHDRGLFHERSALWA